ncbi:hypothetical protein ADICEAN_02680 [Cesiribacter andamanensis AMV16]|uniref:Uncharacterized protein n=1 Tax=Cesiribacter andamanensis AMV16 TaxID=1279009 RepID=M7N4L2_9BACT|nr:hypothetical protein ADICEAN_02680 [Cesiribacter andamanensis AMV16]
MVVGAAGIQDFHQAVYILLLQVLAHAVYRLAHIILKDGVGQVAGKSGQAVVIAIQAGVGHTLPHAGVHQVVEHIALNVQHPAVYLRIFVVAKVVKAPALWLQVGIYPFRHIKGIGAKAILGNGLHGALLLGGRHGGERLRGAFLLVKGTVYVHTAHIAADHPKAGGMLAGQYQVGIAQGMEGFIFGYQAVLKGRISLFHHFHPLNGIANGIA